MSNPQYSSTGGLGWAFWPSSDRYSLVPKWHEWHGISGKVAFPSEEANRLSLIGYLDVPESFFLVNVSEYDEELDTNVAPGGTPVFEGKVTVPFGFVTSRDLIVDAVVDDGTSEWTGDVLVRIPLEVRQSIGSHVSADFYVDWWSAETPDDRTRISYGTMVFR